MFELRINTYEGNKNNSVYLNIIHLVHQIVNSSFKKLNFFWFNEQVSSVKILENKFRSKSICIIQMEEKLFHLWITFNENTFLNIDHGEIRERTNWFDEKNNLNKIYLRKWQKINTKFKYPNCACAIEHVISAFVTEHLRINLIY